MQVLTADSWCCISQVLQYARDFWFGFFFFIPFWEIFQI